MQNNYPNLILDVQKYNSEILEQFAEETHKRCLIFGNGPSVLEANPDLDEAFICRTNWFFLEDKPLFGTRVDAYFFGIYNKEMLKELILSRYKIKHIFCPINIFESCTINEYLHNVDILKTINHWTIIASNKNIGREFIKRPLPTQGIQMIATAAILGFKNIEVYGVDFYQNKNTRYYYQQSAASLSALQDKDITPGYEENHSLETDKNILNIILKEFPQTSITIH